MMRALLASLAVAGLALAGASAARSADKSPELVWATSCGHCHGGPMNAPELRGLPMPEEYIVMVARQGADGMPPFHLSELSDEELAALAHWIVTQPIPAQGVSE